MLIRAANRHQQLINQDFFQVRLTLSPVTCCRPDFTIFRVGIGVSDVTKNSRLYAVTSTTCSQTSCCVFSTHGHPASTSPAHLVSVCARGRTLRIPARDAYPPHFGARGPPYPPGKDNLTPGYPGTRFLAGYPVLFFEFFSRYFSATKNEILVEGSTCFCSIPKRRVRKVFIVESMH